jgi:hypothetical protein
MTPDSLSGTIGFIPLYSSERRHVGSTFFTESFALAVVRAAYEPYSASALPGLPTGCLAVGKRAEVQ